MNIHFLIFPTSCSAHRIPRIPESVFFRFMTFCSARRSPRIHESAFLSRLSTSCSAHRSPRIPESAIVDISDVLFFAKESQNS